MPLPKKISQLPSVVTIKNADLFAIVQDDVTSNVTFAILESVISGYTASADTYVTGGVYNSGTTSIDFTGNTDFPPFSVDVSSLQGGYWTSGTGTSAVKLINSSSLASGNFSVAEGYETDASGDSSHAEGYGSTASGYGSHAEGSATASGTYSHAEGYGSTASGGASHAEGKTTIASGYISHAEGFRTTASGIYSHSGGKGLDGGSNKIIASGDTSFIHFKQTSTSGIIGAYGDYSAILGGNDHNIGTGSTSSGIFVGSGNTISDNVLRSVVLGGQNITGTTNDTVYLPNITLSGTSEIPGFITMQPGGGMISGDISAAYGGHGFTSIGGPRIINKSGDESMALCIDHPYVGSIDYKNGAGADDILKFGVTTSAGTTGLTTSFGTGEALGIIINSDTSKISSGVTRSVIIGGSLITGTTSDTVYVPNLNIGTIGVGTPITNLGIDSAGNVTSGITEHNDFFIKRTLVKSEILALTGTPIELISAPGPGKIILPHQIHVLYKFSGTGYTATGSFNTMSIGQSGFTWMTVTSTTFEKLEDWLITDNSIGENDAAIYNQPLSVSITNDGLSDPSGLADGTIQIDVHYDIMDST